MWVDLDLPYGEPDESIAGVDDPPGRPFAGQRSGARGLDGREQAVTDARGALTQFVQFQGEWLPSATEVGVVDRPPMREVSGRV